MCHGAREPAVFLAKKVFACEKFPCWSHDVQEVLGFLVQGGVVVQGEGVTGEA